MKFIKIIIFFYFFVMRNLFSSDILYILNSAYIISSGGSGINSKTGTTGIFSNPAYIINSKSFEISLNHLLWFYDYNVEHLSVASPFKYGYAGLGFFYYHQSEDYYINEICLKTTEILDKSDIGVSISYGNIFWGIPLGFKFLYMSNTLIDKSSSTFLFDIGVQQGYYINEHNLILAGISLMNLGFGPKFLNERLSIPYKFLIDLDYIIKPDGVINFAISSSIKLNELKEATGGVGLELEFFKKYRLRMARYFEYSMKKFCLGFGMDYNIKNKDFQFNYGFILNEGLGPWHSFEVVLKFDTEFSKPGKFYSYKNFEFDKFKRFLSSEDYIDQEEQLKEFAYYSSEVDIISAEASSEIQPAINACDKNNFTRWESEHQKDPQWIIFTLGNVEEVKGIKISWENASAKRYEILSSTDKRNWEKVWTVNDGKMGEERIIKFYSPVKAKYIKILGRTRNGDWGYSIWEVKILK